LMARSLDERGHLIDGTRELNLLPGGVVEEAATVVSHEVADDQGHLKSISSETRLIAAHDDIARLCLGQETTETIARVEVIAGFTIVHVLDDLGRSRQPESLDEVN